MSYNDVDVLHHHIEAIASTKKKVMNFIGSDYPTELEEYVTNLKNIMSNNLCDFFSKQEVDFGKFQIRVESNFGHRRVQFYSVRFRA